MGKRADDASTPPTRTAPRAYDALYAEYRALHDYFGRVATTCCTGCARSATRQPPIEQPSAAALIGSGAQTTVDRLRETVAALHGELTRSGLVAWTAGNVSARVPGHDLHGDQAERRLRTTSSPPPQ